MKTWSIPNCSMSDCQVEPEIEALACQQLSGEKEASPK